jgi:CelD/BcsL family acetyltransferase involved in cellulose biosynthesis
MPLALRRLGPWRVAEFIGGRMANYQMGLFRDPEGWSAEDTTALLSEVLRLARLDWLQFSNQPLAWRGRPNPLATLGGAQSPSFAFSTGLTGDFECWTRAHFSTQARKKRRAKTRRLEALGAIFHQRAETPEARRAALDAFFAQRRASMGARNLPNEFEAPDNVAFIERLAGAEPALELHALKVGERIVSVFGGLCAHGRLSGLIFSHDISEDVAAASPGELMLAEIVRDAIRRNLAEFDLGVGEARYKSECCEVAEPLIDAAFAATFFGRVAASLFLQMRALKRRVKRSPRFLELARLAQRWDFRRRVR